MFERSISKAEVLKVINSGGVIAEYPDDKPLPSCLLLGFISDRPVHIVVATESDTGTYLIITAYDPNPELWDADFKRRRPL